MTNLIADPTFANLTNLPSGLTVGTFDGKPALIFDGGLMDGLDIPCDAMPDGDYTTSWTIADGHASALRFNPIRTTSGPVFINGSSIGPGDYSSTKTLGGTASAVLHMICSQNTGNPWTLTDLVCVAAA